MPSSTTEGTLLNKQYMGDRPWETFKQGEEEMNILIYLIAGAIVGYVASRIMKTNSQQGPLMDIVVGVVGAFLAGYFISPLLGVGTINDAITVPTLLVSLLGAVILLWIYKMVAARR
jgi:uncharacterized membrane protein YeaQ/YmgE (transglycosylase-associated protein family)